MVSVGAAFVHYHNETELVLLLVLRIGGLLSTVIILVISPVLDTVPQLTMRFQGPLRLKLSHRRDTVARWVGES